MSKILKVFIGVFAVLVLFMTNTGIEYVNAATPCTHPESRRETRETYSRTLSSTVHEFYHYIDKAWDSNGNQIGGIWVFCYCNVYNYEYISKTYCKDCNSMISDNGLVFYQGHFRGNDNWVYCSNYNRGLYRVY